MFAKQTRRTQKTFGTRFGEHLSEPTSCRQVLLTRKHRRERNTFCTCFANARKSTLGTWLAGGMELRSRVKGGRYLPEQLRVRVHCRWRVTPSLSCCLWPLSTQFCVAGIGINLFSGSQRKLVKGEQPAVVFAQTGPRADQPSQPSRMWPKRLPVVCISRRIGIPRFFFDCEF